MRTLASRSLHHVRREYRNAPLEEENLPEDPLALFRTWFDLAMSAGIVEPNAMSLATADRAGRVTCRTVLLKAYDERGFVFFSNYGSEKARQIAENKQVALLFPWLPLSQQVEITGSVEKISNAESVAYFLKRPFKSRIGAWVSAQSSVVSSRRLLEAKFAEMCEKFANGEVPRPAAWGGYRVAPETIEFWQGGAHRLHDRFLYSRTARGAWQIQRLSP